MARVGYKNWAVDAAGAIVASAAVELRLAADNSLATLYTALTGGTTKTNPFNAETDGSFEFWAERPGLYTLLVGSGASQESITLNLVDGRNGMAFGARSELVAAVADGYVAYDGAVIFVDGLAYEYLTGATGISDLPGWVPWGDVYPDHFASNTTPGTTNMTAAINAAIAYLVSIGGGVVNLRAETYSINATISVPQKVHFKGQGGWFKNQYSSTDFEVGGSVVKLAAGSDVDMFLVRYSVGSGEVIADYRVHVSFRDMLIFGNRSANQAPTAKDINSAGNGVTVSGSRYVDFENVTIIKCADDGIECVSHDYGSGAISCNNIHPNNTNLLSNGGRGIAATGGDSMMWNCQVGYNGLSGITSTGWGTISDCLIWNNRTHGIYVGAQDEPVTITGCKIYDNVASGISLGDATSRATITGNSILRNGTGGTGASENSGIYVNTTDPDAVVIVGNNISNNTDLGTQDYGIYFASGNTRAIVEGNTIYNNAVADIFRSSPLNMRTYKVATTVLTTGTTLIDMSSAEWEGIVMDITVAHNGGANAAWCRVLGDTTTPLIISQETIGTGAFTFSISSGNLVITSTGSTFTSTATITRVV